MIRIVPGTRILTTVFILLFGILAGLLIGCGNAAVRPWGQPDQAVVHPFLMFTDAPAMLKRNQTLATRDTSFIAILWEEADRIRLVKFGRDLTEVWSTTINLEEGEQHPELFMHLDTVLIFSRQTDSSNQRRALARRVDPTSGTVGALNVVLRTNDALPHQEEDGITSDRWFDFIPSGDSSRILVSGFGSERSGGYGAIVSSVSFHAAVVDLNLTSLHERHGTIENPVDGLDSVLRVMVPGPGTSIDVLLIVPTADSSQVVMRRFEAGTEEPTMETTAGLPIPTTFREQIRPAQLLARPMADGSVVAVTTLLRRNDLYSILRISTDPSDGGLDVSTLFFSDSYSAQHLVRKDAVERYPIVDFDIGSNGGILLLLERWWPSTKSRRGRMSEMIDPTRRAVIGRLFGPIGVLYFEDGRTLTTLGVERSHSRLYNGSASSYLLEKGLAYDVRDNSLFLLSRETGIDGLRMYNVDLQDGVSRSMWHLADLGDKAYMATGYTTWLADGSLVVWVKKFGSGVKWEMVRIMP